MEYLDFELPIKELQEQYEKACLIGEESDVDVSNTCKQIEKKLKDKKTEIYNNLTPWQRVQLSRHPDRPYTMDYLNAICGSFSKVAKSISSSGRVGSLKQSHILQRALQRYVMIMEPCKLFFAIIYSFPVKLSNYSFIHIITPY